ncbi:MAG: HNH endonuclease [Candidatus Binataceae bacterium]
MSRTRISIVGMLQSSNEDDLVYSILIGSPPRPMQLAGLPDGIEGLPDVHDWPGLGKYPEKPKPGPPPRFGPPAAWQERRAKDEAAKRKWREDCDAYMAAVHSDPTYKKASEFKERQRREPQPLMRSYWVYRDKVVQVDSIEPNGTHTGVDATLLIKHFVLRQERHYERVRREVEALENMERLGGVAREPVPEGVRLFVWQRDQGQCVKCGSRERLEFDHIIPVSAGGSSTERNIQILCEACNRAKAATV